MKARLNTLPASPGALRNRKVAVWLVLLVCAVTGIAWLASNSSPHANASQTGLYFVPGQEVGRLAPNTTYTNTFAPLNIKPYGIPGVVNELNISVQGPDGFRAVGDAYSPQYIAGATPNPEYTQQQYGYLYRVDVPANFPDNHLLVQVFDPDTYNRPDAPPTPYTPVTVATPTFCPAPCGVATATPYSTPTLYPNDGRFTWAGSGERFNAYLNLNAFPITTTPIPTIFGNSRRTAFWRVDEMRLNHNDPRGINPSSGEWSDSWVDTTTFTLWHFAPNTSDPFGDPSTLSDQPGGAPITAYTVGNDPTTDLAWYQPNGYDVTLNDPSCLGPSHDCFARQADGNFYFYIYVQTSAGSSENNFDLRVGPEGTNYAAGYTCNNLSNPNSNICFANTQNFMQATNPGPPPNWDSGGSSPAVVSAMHALELNLDTGDHFPMLFTQLSSDLAGNTLDIRHFDQDCSGGCGPNHTMQYQMQLCVADGHGGYTPCSDLNSDGCFGNPSGSNGVGYVGPNDGWLCPDGNDSNCPPGWTEPTDQLQIPAPGTSDYTQFFGPQGQCGTSWLRLQSDPSYQQDTTVWQIVVESTSTPTSTATSTFTFTPTNTSTYSPTNTPVETATGTQQAQMTLTSIAATQTAVAIATETSLAATVFAELTQTAIAIPTQTAVAATQTAGAIATLTRAAGATQTSISATQTAVAATQTAINIETGTSVAATAIAGLTQTAGAIATQTADAPTSTRTNTPTVTATVATTSTSTATSTPTSTYPPASPTSPAQRTASATSTSTVTASSTRPPALSPTTPAQPTNTATTPPTETATYAAIASATATICAVVFIDVPADSTFYPYVHCLACIGIINGYSDGSFRPNNNVTRGQLAKIVSNSAGFSDHQGTRTFQDVPPGSVFFDFVGRLASRGIMQGYPCGGGVPPRSEPCETGNLPYFRPASNATRGQISKIVSNAAGFEDPQPSRLFQDVPMSNAFHDYIGRLASRGYMSGYPCGGSSEPCVPPGNLPYFRPNNDATRGQTSKIVANTFFPDCRGIH